MKIHILGICGTFMGGIAILARHLGHQVSGSDANVYPPMSTMLEEQGIELRQGYSADNIDADTDMVIVGNAMSRGNEAVEYILNSRFAYCSGPEWLGQHFLDKKTTIAVAGTHGKTTTSSMVAWILECHGLNPGFLIGGVPGNFPVSARPGSGEVFVVEADEYDTAFFDKRSKFVHYRPKIALLNNLEYDHADIFPDLEAIQTQFHHLVRTIPGNGQIILNAHDEALEEVLQKGCWTPVSTFGLVMGDWRGRFEAEDQSSFSITPPQGIRLSGRWKLSGKHNLMNALGAVAAATACGVPAASAVSALESFSNPKRRQELIWDTPQILVYDDFAHHPTAFAATLAGLRQRHPVRRLVAVLEPRSNTMRSGAHVEHLANSLSEADQVYFLQRLDLEWDAKSILSSLGERLICAQSVNKLLIQLCQNTNPGDCIVFMSNGGFEGAQSDFLTSLKETYGST